ncbi:hemagglutinin [Paraburkholderia phymatum]|uniref:Putative hemagglutinin-related transmembrane protein n=1 Tax=Paraburkholderia phymatum (strain DSM 17167 / CIP 108236 / LMG 21445 / STM815) TaxID=391038 RepID=B2JNA9_PARP8|nr:hemagglutinin-related protein [Paraburkholderia phymatum]ACC72957.1 putative hemagglutinin-related transmembrane protein [Paraburkholderia phymatum STM815]
MGSQRTTSIAASVAALTLVATLAACGGGGGGNSTAVSNTAKGTPASSDVPIVAADGKLHAACQRCSATDDSTYAGSGAGIWQAINPNASALDVPVSIKGLSGQNVTLVFTNESAGTQTMSPITLSANMSTSVMRAQSQAAATSSTTGSESATLAAIRDFNYQGWTQLATNQQATATARYSTNGAATSAFYSAGTWQVGDTRTFYYADNSPRTTTLEQTATTSDGTTVNLWVESGEIGASKISPQIIHSLITQYAQAGGIYDMLVRVGGKLYGPNSQSSLIDGTHQPIDLVVMNFDHNGLPYGLLGYFWALNNFKTGAGQLAYSNQSISLYLDSETLYLGGTYGMNQMLTTMAHESMHMQNFYRRSVQMGAQYAFEPWLEEMTAMMMEDWASSGIVPGYNAIRDARFITYMTYGGHGSYNCGLTTWTPYGTDCESYAVNGSFGGFMNRQFGLSFFQSLLTNKNRTASLDILNEVIGNARAGATVPSTLRGFAAAASGLVPLSSNVAGFTFPARSESGFTLPAIDPASLYNGATRALPASVPATLAALGTFPVVRSHVSGTYSETVRVPVGTTLSVVVD